MNGSSVFRAYPSIGRYRKNVTITEKIDGTNACVVILQAGDISDVGLDVDYIPSTQLVCGEAGQTVYVAAQSRKRMITSDKDNHGFARWVEDHREELYVALGNGYHYGEWWGSGINRGYGLKNGEKHFTLFNPGRYDLSDTPESLVTTVPVLYQGPSFIPDEPNGFRGVDAVTQMMLRLKHDGSSVRFAEGYDNPEGVVVYHTASHALHKVTFEYDEGKWTATSGT